jgi:hypothetical protein
MRSGVAGVGDRKFLLICVCAIDSTNMSMVMQNDDLQFYITRDYEGCGYRKLKGSIRVNVTTRVVSAVG